MLKKLIALIKRRLTLTPQSDSEFIHRARLLQISAFLGVGGAFFLMAVNIGHRTYPQAIALSVLTVVNLAALVMIKRGNLHLPSILMPTAMLLVLTSNLITGNGTHDPGMVAYPLILVYVTFLLGRRAALIYTGLEIGSMAVVILAQNFGWAGTSDHTPGGWLDLIVMMTLLLATAAVLWMMMEALEHSLARANRSEARWRSLVVNAPVWIINTDLVGEIKFINRLNLDQRRTGLIGENIVSLVPVDESVKVQQQIVQVATGGSGEPFEISGRAMGRPQASFSVSLGPIQASDDRVEGLTFVLVDISDQKRAEEAVTNMNTALELRVNERTTQLETAIKELETFSYSISHDLRTPLRAIDGFSQLVLEDYYQQLDEVGKDYLRRVRSATQRMGLLLDDLVELFRLALTELEYQEVDLSEIAAEIVQSLQLNEPARQVHFMITPELTVVGDRRLLRLALEHLFGNAWKFTAPRDRAEVSFGQYLLDDHWVFFVQDNGVGFDMRYSGKLFNAFQSLHSPGEYSGSGIGLAIVQRIIHKHGGRVWGESPEDRGAIFYFTISDGTVTE